MIVMALRTDGNQRYNWMKNRRSLLVNWTRPRTWRCSTMSCCLSAAFSASSQLLDLNNDAPRFKRKNISVTIAGGVKPFCHQSKTDKVFRYAPLVLRKRQNHGMAVVARRQVVTGPPGRIRLERFSPLARSVDFERYDFRVGGFKRTYRGNRIDGRDTGDIERALTAIAPRLRATGIRDKPTAPRSPCQNPYVERLIGTILRECLDHMIVFGEAH